jgi:hypothetical protein
MATLLPYALTTLADVKETLSIDSGNTSKDNLLIRKINQATEMIEKFTGRHFALTTYTNEEYDATNTDQLILKHRPVVTFSSFQNGDSSLNEGDWSDIETDLYFSDLNAGVIDLNFRASGRWNRYRVTYSAGYATIPSDVAEAAASLAAYMAENPTNGSTIQRKREGQREVYYFDAQTTGSSDTALFRQLGIYTTLVAYSDYPVLADK